MAMVVTASRHSAVKMARAIRSYIADLQYDTKYPDLGVLVAFSGSLTIDGEETTEVKEDGSGISGTDRDFKSNLDRSARRAAWPMIRREEGLDDL